MSYALEEWYPSRIAFGKHKGKSIYDARKSAELRDWLEWLAGSSNARSASMGRWYLRELEERGTGCQPVQEMEQAGSLFHTGPEARGDGVVVYAHPGLERLRGVIATSRARLAELEAAYTSEKNHVSALHARMFQRLRQPFEERDRLRLMVNYRRTFLDTLLREGEEEAGRVLQVDHGRPTGS